MRLEDFFMICFGVGASLAVISFLAGRLHFHLPTKFHLPHIGHGGHVGHGTHGVPKMMKGFKGPMKGGDVGGGEAGGVADATYVSPFNFPSLMMFLAWFGGVGFLVTHQYGMGLFLAAPLALLGGLAGGWIVYAFLKMAFSYEDPLVQADFDMVGVVGRLSIGVRAGEDGHGELIFEQQGRIRACGARSENGAALEKDAEVVVTAFDHGIATVRRWEEFSGM